MTEQRPNDPATHAEEAATGGDELTLDKETIQDLDPTDPDAAAVQGGLRITNTSGTLTGCTASCGC